MTDINDILLNRGNKTRRQDNFYVKFMNMNENVGNFLGGQVKSVGRPDITVETKRRGTGSAQYIDPSQIRFEPVSVTFFDDEEGLTSMLLYAQLMRQQARYKGQLDRVLGVEDTYKRGRFGMSIGLYNSKQEETEGYVLQDCILMSISHSEGIQSGGEQRNEIIVRVGYDNMELKVMDRFLEFFT